MQTPLDHEVVVLAGRRAAVAERGVAELLEPAHLALNRLLAAVATTIGELRAAPRLGGVAVLATGAP